MPTFRLGQQRVYFAAARRHRALCGAATDLVLFELGDRNTLKGAVQFPRDRPILEDLTRKLVVGQLRPLQREDISRRRPF